MTEQQGIRKAAVFLNGLDKETAGLLLGRLPAEESRAIRREMVAVAGISPNEINKTVRQFLKDTGYEGRGTRITHTDIPHKTILSDDGDLFELSGTEVSAKCKVQSVESIAAGMERSAMTGRMCGVQSAEYGVELNEHHSQLPTPNSKLVPPPSPLAPLVETPAEPRRFDFLERRSAFETAGFLAEEGEQLIAVVLSQLTPRYSGDVLACFEQSLKRDLIRRLARLDATDETILDEIDAVLKDRLKREVEDLPKTKPGLALLERILQVVENEWTDSYGQNIGFDILSGLNEIEQEDRDQGSGGRDQEPEVWTFEDLGWLEDHELAELFLPLDRDLVVQSLAGCHQRNNACDAWFVERVLGLFPVYEQVSLREMLDHAASTDSAEQNYARECVMSGIEIRGEGRRTRDESLTPHSSPLTPHSSPLAHSW